MGKSRQVEKIDVKTGGCLWMQKTLAIEKTCPLV